MHPKPIFSTRTRSVRAVGLAVAAVLIAQAAMWSPVAVAGDQVVFGEALAAGWASWSWGSAVDFTHEPGYQGTRSIGWRPVTPWAGLYLRPAQPVPIGSLSSIRFALRTSDPSDEVSVRLYGNGDRPAGWPMLVSDFGRPAPGAWRTYDLALSAFGVVGQAVSGIVFQNATGVVGPLVELDEVALGTVPVAGAVEIRPDNTVANNTRGRPTRPELFNADPSFRPYYDQINGNHVGTTEEILAWAAHKWGFDRLGYPDLAKSMAVVESWWNQSAANPSGARGILQVKPADWPDADPATWSTAYNADYAMAVVRYLYDPGSWLGRGTVGSITDAVAAWECGCGYNGLESYAARVFSYNVTKPWLRPGQPPEWF